MTLGVKAAKLAHKDIKNLLVSKTENRPYPGCCHKTGYKQGDFLSNSCHKVLPYQLEQSDPHQQI